MKATTLPHGPGNSWGRHNIPLRIFPIVGEKKKPGDGPGFRVCGVSVRARCRLILRKKPERQARKEMETKHRRRPVTLK